MSSSLQVLLSPFCLLDRAELNFEKSLAGTLIYDVPVSNVTVVEDYGGEDELEEDVDLSLDTVSIISNEVNDMKELNEEQKTKLKLMIRDLYMESLTV